MLVLQQTCFINILLYFWGLILALLCYRCNFQQFDCLSWPTWKMLFVAFSGL